MMEDNEQLDVPVVSICMPVYNGEEYLVSALDSVLAQTYQSYELIISDNGSDDKTQEICNRYCALDPRIRYVRHESNHSVHWNFNFVAQNAKGRFMTWFAHDDILEPDFISESANHLVQHSETVLVSCDFQIIDEIGTEIRVEKIEKIRKNVKWKNRQIEFFKNPNLNVYYCIYGMMRTDVCQSIMISIKEPRIVTGMEFSILARFAVTGEIESIPKVLRKYRKHATSVYSTESAAAAKVWKGRRLASRLVNIYRQRFEQMKILFCSSQSFRSKCRVFLFASLAHKRLFIRTLLKTPFEGRDI